MAPTELKPRIRLTGEGPADMRVTLAMACAATLLVLMNYTAPMTTLPQIAAGLGAGVLLGVRVHGRDHRRGRRQRRRIPR